MGPSNQLKQIIQIEHKNPTWQEANQLPIYKRGWEFELGATEKQIRVVARTRTRDRGIASPTRWPLGQIQVVASCTTE